MANFLNPLNPTNFGMNVTGNFNNLASSGTFRLPSSGKVSSSGPKLSIQLSDGNGAFIHDPKIKVTKQTESALGTPLQDPISRLVLDSSDSVNAPEPISRLRFIPPSGGAFASSAQPLNGDVAYFSDGSLTAPAPDLRFYNGTNWLSLTDAGAAPSTAAGPQYAVQFNATGIGGALGGTSDFIFDDSGVNNNLTIISELNLTTPSGTLTYDSSGLGVNITSPGSGISMVSVSGDISLLTQSGNVSITSTSSGTQPKSVSLVSGNSNAEFVSYSSTRESWLQLSNPISTPYTVQSSWKTSGLLIAADSGNSGYTTGSGVGLYLESEVDAAAPTILSQRATFELRSKNSSIAPFTPISRVYMQAPSQQFNSGYRVLFSRGTTTSTGPTPDNLGNGDILKSGEFYIGENRAPSGAPTNRPHINYNLAGGVTPSSFGTFNICNSTLAISDDTEIPKFVAMRKTTQLDGQITVGDATSNRVDIRGGDSGINSVNVGMITVNGSTTTSGGGEFRAKSTSASLVTSVLTTAAGTNGEGQLYLYSGAAAPTSTNYGLLASGANDGTLTLGGNSPNIVLNGDGTGTFKGTVNLIGGTGSNNPAVLLSSIQTPSSIGKSVLQINYDSPTTGTGKTLEIENYYSFDAANDYGALIEFKPFIGGTVGGTTKAGLILNSFGTTGSPTTLGLQLGNVEGAAGQGVSMILDAGIASGQSAGEKAALYLGNRAQNIFDGTSNILRTRRCSTVGGFGPVYPSLVQQGPTVIGGNTSSAIFGWNFSTDKEEPVYIGWDVTAGATGGLVVRGNVNITGSIAAGGAKSFCIDHPEPEKTLTQNLYHSCIETPTAGDNLYRYRVTTVNNKAVIKLPTYFRYLNENEMIWVSPVDSFGRAYGKLSPDRLEVHVTSDQDGDYNVLVMGTRYDKNAKAYWKGAERMKKGN